MGLYLLSLLSQPLTHVATMSSTARLDAVFLATGTVIKKEIVLMVLMNLPLVVREQANMKCVMMQLENLFQLLQI